MKSEAGHKTRTLWVSGILHAFTHLYQVALLPLYLMIERDLKLASVSHATLLLTVMMVAYFAPSYPAGVLADRLSRKKLLGFGLAINALGFIILGLAPNYAWALAGVAVAGFGGSFYHPSATAMVARLFPVGTGKALGLVGIGASIGFFAGPIYAGWRAGTLEPILGAAAWRRPVLELGALGLVGAAAFAWLADNERPAPPSEHQSKRSQKLFPAPALWFFFLIGAAAFSLRDFAGTSMGSLSSLFLQNAHGYDPKWTGLALSGIYLASVISNPIFGGLSDRGRKRWTMLVLSIAALMVLLLPHAAPGWTIPIFVIFGFFFMSSYPMTEAALMESVPDPVRGRVFGLFITVGGLMGNLSHWVVGAYVKGMGATAYSVGAYFGIYAVLGLMMALSPAGLLCLLRLPRHEQKLEPELPAAEFKPVAE